jgi:hypothetical protein
VFWQFDPRCRTEDRYDYLKLYVDESHSNVYGREQYTGTAKDWPGMPRQPALIIDSDRFILFFHS